MLCKQTPFRCEILIFFFIVQLKKCETFGWGLSSSQEKASLLCCLAVADDEAQQWDFFFSDGLARGKFLRMRWDSVQFLIVSVFPTFAKISLCGEHLTSSKNFLWGILIVYLTKLASPIQTTPGYSSFLEKPQQPNFFHNNNPTRNYSGRPGMFLPHKAINLRIFPKKCKLVLSTNYN